MSEATPMFKQYEVVEMLTDRGSYSVTILSVKTYDYKTDTFLDTPVYRCMSLLSGAIFKDVSEHDLFFHNEVQPI